MAIQSITVTINCTQSVSGPDALSLRATGSTAASGVSSGGPAIVAKELANIIMDVANGEFIPSVTAANPNYAGLWVVDGITLASMAVVFTGNGTAADTVTINGQALAAVASGAVANQWNVGTSTATAAANLAAAINATTTNILIRGTVYASILPSVPSTVIVTSLFGGVIGNLISIAKTSTSITALGGAVLAGGASNQPGIFPA